MVQDFRYPIGKYEPKEFSNEQKEEWLSDIKFLPNAVESAVTNLDEKQLHTPYRDGGWTVHQLVHHVADSHMHAYMRFKFGYFDNNPTIKPYDENLWVTSADVEHLPVNISITLLYSLHHRLYEFLQALTDEDCNKTIVHPDHEKPLTLWHLLGMYAWHGKHHVAHITNLRERMNWY